MIAKKKMILDMGLNIIAVSVPLAVLQLIIYPVSAKVLGGESYGLMITIYSVWIMISNSLGNVLNNVRLLQNDYYESEGIQGDFLLILKRWNVINAAVVCVIIFFYYQRFDITHICLGTIISCMILTKGYLEVEFRLNLNYKAVVINNILQSTGFLIGGIIAYFTRIWEFIFLAGYFFSCIYIIKQTSLLNESIAKTKFFPKVSKDCHVLVLSAIINNLVNYADKLVLYPLMGGYSVSIYYTATILGKIISMVTGPINSVILSYISKWDIKRKNIMNKVFASGFLVTVVGYVITVVISRSVIGILFPQWLNEVMIYLPVTTVTVSLQTLISIIQPFFLKFCEMKWQVVISMSGAIIYFLSALILWKTYGLMGFCVGTVIGTFAKLIIMIVIYYCGNKTK